MLFALYAVGLIPGLLVGGAASDRHGRRAVVLPLVVLSPVAAPGVAARRSATALTAGFACGPLVAALLAQWAPGPLWLPYFPHLALGVVAAVLLRPARDAGVPRAPGGPLLRVPRVSRSPRFVRTVAIVAPWVFGCAAFSFAVLRARPAGRPCSWPAPAVR